MNIEAMKQALNALELCNGAETADGIIIHTDKEIASVRQAIEAAERQEPVAWQERQARRMKDGVVTEWTGWYPCRYRTVDEARAEACDHIPYEWRPLYTHPPKREPLTEWLPIETAPNGTAVLVMRDIWPGSETGRAEKCVGHNTYVAAWWADESNSGQWFCYMDRIEEPICPIAPTHWMPLPPPPIEAAHGIKGDA